MELIEEIRWGLARGVPALDDTDERRAQRLRIYNSAFSYVAA
jgi:hypothetical protein